MTETVSLLGLMLPSSYCLRSARGRFSFTWGHQHDNLCKAIKTKIKIYPIIYIYIGSSAGNLAAYWHASLMQLFCCLVAVQWGLNCNTAPSNFHAIVCPRFKPSDLFFFADISFEMNWEGYSFVIY